MTPPFLIRGHNDWWNGWLTRFFGHGNLENGSPEFRLGWETAESEGAWNRLLRFNGELERDHWCAPNIIVEEQ